MKKTSPWKTACALFLFCSALTITSPAQTFTTLLDFDGTDGGCTNYMYLVQGSDSNFYGTTACGGANNGGTVFKITVNGTLTTLHNFSGTDGLFPEGGVMQATNGNLYGTTYSGGANHNSNCPANGCGTVFKITPGGALTTLHNFDGTDGWGPYAGLVQSINGAFYGSTSSGGANEYGTVFKITPGGTLTTLHSFDGSDGSVPYAPLAQAIDGNFYGTTVNGGSPNWGTVFKITPGGKLTTLHSFNRTDGADPYGALVQGTDGNFYGTTLIGNTVFKITTAGALTTLYSFTGNAWGADGGTPYAGLVQGTDGNLYGTTSSGGNLTCDNPVGCGTVFKITLAGTVTILHSFDGTDGASPQGGLLQATDGNFYGTTVTGGTINANCTFGCGTVFSLSVGLGPFVETRPTSGRVGAQVLILGNNLTGTTIVSFNGTAAKFKVVSGSEIKTTVPAGATSGNIEVTTPSGTLRSNVPFHVIP